MRIIDIHERSIAISRYADPGIPSGGLTTSLVALETDVVRAGRRIVGYGYASVGRFAQGGLIRERFAPRLLAASESDLLDAAGCNLDPRRAWQVMMRGEKPGGHGERCVAVGALDMALWDAAAKIAGLPLHRFIAERVGKTAETCSQVRVYAGGGYLYPQDDLTRLADEMRACVDLGFSHAKIKIGASGLDQDCRRIEVAAAQLHGPGHLAVDAMNSYDAVSGLAAAARLAPYGLQWFEDICDPLDFETQAGIAAAYAPPIAAGEALFSPPEAWLLHRHGGLRPERDILVFDPVHCYGLTGYLRILDRLTAADWRHEAFWPHGGHLFGLHVVAALGLGGAEINPCAFQPFSGLGEGVRIASGQASLPDAPGIGFEGCDAVWKVLRDLSV